MNQIIYKEDKKPQTKIKKGYTIICKEGKKASDKNKKGYTIICKEGKKASDKNKKGYTIIYKEGKKMEVLVEYLAKGFLIMLAISMPCVLVAAGIGLVVGILQAVTQVQEQTIAAAPKILGVFLVIVIGGIGFINMLKSFTLDGMSMAFNLISKNDTYVLPADYYKYTSPFEHEMSDKFKNQSSINDMMKNPGKVPFIDQQQKTKYYASPQTPMPRPNFVETNQILGR